jgi:hypothetical protein
MQGEADSKVLSPLHDTKLAGWEGGVRHIRRAAEMEVYGSQILIV